MTNRTAKPDIRDRITEADEPEAAGQQPELARRPNRSDPRPTPKQCPKPNRIIKHITNFITTGKS